MTVCHPQNQSPAKEEGGGRGYKESGSVINSTGCCTSPVSRHLVTSEKQSPSDPATGPGFQFVTKTGGHAQYVLTHKCALRYPGGS